MPAGTLSPREVAERLGVHPNSVRNWISAGRVEGVLRTPGGFDRVPSDTVARLIVPVTMRETPRPAA